MKCLTQKNFYNPLTITARLGESFMGVFQTIKNTIEQVDMRNYYKDQGEI